jgi:hypothetical protein
MSGSPPKTMSEAVEQRQLPRWGWDSDEIIESIESVPPPDWQEGYGDMIRDGEQETLHAAERSWSAYHQACYDAERQRIQHMMEEHFQLERDGVRNAAEPIFHLVGRQDQIALPSDLQENENELRRDSGQDAIKSSWMANQQAWNKYYQDCFAAERERIRDAGHQRNRDVERERIRREMEEHFALLGDTAVVEVPNLDLVRRQDELLRSRDQNEGLSNEESAAVQAWKDVVERSDARWFGENAGSMQHG